MNRAQKLIEICEGNAPKTTTILFNTEYEEYRAPGPKGTEAQAIYTDDLNDAEASMIADWKRAGIEVDPASIVVKKVSEWPKGMGN